MGFVLAIVDTEGSGDDEWGERGHGRGQRSGHVNVDVGTSKGGDAELRGVSGGCVRHQVTGVGLSPGLCPKDQNSDSTVMSVAAPQ